MTFFKYHGCGNDFICVDARHQSVDASAIAKAWCSRRFSVGADGVVVIHESSVADAKMVIINADGSRPEMCGNGLRCMVACMIHQGMSATDVRSIETDAGVLSVQVRQTEGATVSMTIDMGVASYPPNPMDMAGPFLTGPATVPIGNDLYDITPVSIGNPHAVIFVDDVSRVDVATIGPMIESHKWFVNRVNVEFIQVTSNTNLMMRVWERGVGETLACGTGACAAVVAAIHRGKATSPCEVELPGGVLMIDYDSVTHRVHMTGPATYVYSGTVSSGHVTTHFDERSMP